MKIKDMNVLQDQDTALGLYLKEVSKYRPLTKTEERDTAVKIRQGDSEALERMVKANLRFVVSVARNYQNQGMPLADLINEGNLGLIKAGARFDERKNFKFISYAVWWIRQSILQGLAEHSRIVKVPLNKVASVHKVSKAKDLLEQKLQRIPTSEEIAQELDISEEEVLKALKINNSHKSLDAPVGEGQNAVLMDTIRDESSEGADDTAMKESQSKILSEEFRVLNDREKMVVNLYFGIDEDIGYTLNDIARRMNITRERVRQIKDSALKKLKKSKKLMHLKHYVV